VKRGNKMYKIMIVEDDIEIREELKILLQNNGYEVKVTTNFENVEKQILEEQCHLILLDINLPNKNGYEICSKIRTKSKLPIIFVTSRNSSMDELNGIMLGGDDYIEKPYNVPVLLARIQNLLNRVYPKEQKSSKLEYKGITLDILKSQIKYNDKEIELTKTEIKTLYYLLKNTDRIIARTEIIDYLWDNEVYADDNSLSVVITRLREKLKKIGVEHLIETKRGQGYKL
jgi:two component transcriptional regulator, winged helix family